MRQRRRSKVFGHAVLGQAADFIQRIHAHGDIGAADKQSILRRLA